MIIYGTPEDNKFLDEFWEQNAGKYQNYFKIDDSKKENSKIDDSKKVNVKIPSKK